MLRIILWHDQLRDRMVKVQLNPYIVLALILIESFLLAMVFSWFAILPAGIVAGFLSYFAKDTNNDQA